MIFSNKRGRFHQERRRYPIMTDKQRVFCEEYLLDLNATQAAIRAGYSPKSANQQAAELLAKPSLRAYVDKLMADRSRRTGVNSDRVVRELARIAFVDPTDIINMDEATVRDGASKDDRAVIASVKCKTTTISSDDFEKVTEEREVKLQDKIKALDLLGKHLGMFADKGQQLPGGLGVVILPAVEIEDDPRFAQDDPNSAK